MPPVIRVPGLDRFIGRIAAAEPVTAGQHYQNYLMGMSHGIGQKGTKAPLDRSARRRKNKAAAKSQRRNR